MNSYILTFIIKDLLHWDAKLDSVLRLLFSRPHQGQKPASSEDPQLGIAQLVERISEEICTGWLLLSLISFP